MWAIVVGLMFKYAAQEASLRREAGEFVNAERLLDGRDLFDGRVEALVAEEAVFLLLEPDGADNPRGRALERTRGADRHPARGRDSYGHDLA